MSNVESLLIIVKNANLKHCSFTLLQLASSVLTTASIFFEYTLPLRLMELFVCLCFNKDGNDLKNKLKHVEVRVLLQSSPSGILFTEPQFVPLQMLFNPYFLFSIYSEAEGLALVFIL